MAGSALDEDHQVRMRDVFRFHYLRTDLLALCGHDSLEILLFVTRLC